MTYQRQLAATLFVVANLCAALASAQHRETGSGETPALQAVHDGQSSAGAPEVLPKEKMARIWANEPLLVRLARDKFGDLSETEAKFFAAVTSNNWADLRPTPEATFNPEEPTSWARCPKLKADRIVWLCTEPAAVKLVPSHGIWLRGASIEGRVELYRCDVPFSLTFYDCLFGNGLNISHAKLEELDIRNSCSAAVQARSAQIAENVYLLNTAVFGGLDFIDAQVGGDFDFTGGLAFHGMSADDLKKKGVALNFHDAKVAGDLKLSDKFRAFGQVRLIGATIGRSFSCRDGRFAGGGQLAIDARSANIAMSALFNAGFRGDGGVELRRAKIGSDLDCGTGRFFAAPGVEALDADLTTIGGQVNLGDGFHADGQVSLINATVGGDVGCNNGHFFNPKAIALCLDGATVGRSLRIGADPSAASERLKDLSPGFVSRGTIRLWGTQISQDIIASGAQFEAPGDTAILACNVKVGSRADFSNVKAQGTVNLSSADVEHELDLRCSQFDAKGAYANIALWASGAHIRGHVYCNEVDTPQGPVRFEVRGLTSFQFATIAMHWDLSGARLINPGGDAFDASDSRVSGYVNLDSVLIDGRASFSRAKIDGMWIINKTVEPQKLHLDMRFAHIWVIKDERLDDWPPAGQLQLEGLVYDHFDDDSPLDVNDRLDWLRRQYAAKKPQRGGRPLMLSAGNARPPALESLSAISATDERHPHPSPLPEGEGGSTASHVTREPARLANNTAAGGIVPAEFDAPATMPAPQMSMPAQSPPPIPIPPATREPERYQTVAPNPSGATKPIVANQAKPATEPAAKNDKPNASRVADKSPLVTANPDKEEKKDSEAKKADGAAAPSESESPPDPAGRRYITQPYTQLASVYRAIGQDEQANTVLVARAERIGELAPPFSAHGLWYRYLGRLIGYGYEPFRAIKIGVVIIAIGAIIFAIGARRNLMAETKLAERVLSREDESGIVSPTYPRFNPFVYSLDVFLPFVDLNQVCYWIPGEKTGRAVKSRNCLAHIGPYKLKWSSVLHGYLWFQTLAGWTLCTLLAAAVTGIVQS